MLENAARRHCCCSDHEPVRQGYPAGNPQRRHPVARLHRPTLPQLPPAQLVRRQSSFARGLRARRQSCRTIVSLSHQPKDADPDIAPGGHNRGLKAPSRRCSVLNPCVVLRKGVDRQTRKLAGFYH